MHHILHHPFVHQTSDTKLQSEYKHVTCCGGAVAGMRLAEDGVNNAETRRRKNLNVNEK